MVRVTCSTNADKTCKTAIYHEMYPSPCPGKVPQETCLLRLCLAQVMEGQRNCCLESILAEPCSLGPNFRSQIAENDIKVLGLRSGQIHAEYRSDSHHFCPSCQGTTCLFCSNLASIAAHSALPKLSKHA